MQKILKITNKDLRLLFSLNEKDLSSGNNLEQQRAIFLKSCSQMTITVILSDQGACLGGFCPVAWTDTSSLRQGLREIEIGSSQPGLFYFRDDEIYYCPVVGKTMFIGSDKRYFLSFGGGLYIVNDRRHSDQAYCLTDHYTPQENHGGVG